MSPERSDLDNELARFALAEGVRSIQEQTAEARAMKDRAVTLTGLTAAATALFVGPALDTANRDALFYLPLIAGTLLFIALIARVWRMLSPVKDWRSAVGPLAIIEGFGSPNGWKYLASYYENAFSENDKKLEPLRRNLQICTALSGSIVICWIILIWLTG